ncbi:hypothetical protein [Azospirillum sp.]|uniref:hypothetical protein n=1 Tax=Azospirillum sp. TaxID=34012 RepID=UPI003D71DBA6
MRIAIAVGVLAALAAGIAGAQELTPANAPEVCRTRADAILDAGQRRDRGVPKYQIEQEFRQRGAYEWARNKIDLLYFDPTVSPAQAAQAQFTVCTRDAGKPR